VGVCALGFRLVCHRHCQYLGLKGRVSTGSLAHDVSAVSGQSCEMLDSIDRSCRGEELYPCRATIKQDAIPLLVSSLRRTFRYPVHRPSQTVCFWHEKLDDTALASTPRPKESLISPGSRYCFVIFRSFSWHSCAIHKVWVSRMPHIARIPPTPFRTVVAHRNRTFHR